MVPKAWKYKTVLEPSQERLPTPDLICSLKLTFVQRKKILFLILITNHRTAAVYVKNKPFSILKCIWSSQVYQSCCPQPIKWSLISTLLKHLVAFLATLGSSLRNINRVASTLYWQLKIINRASGWTTCTSNQAVLTWLSFPFSTVFSSSSSPALITSTWIPEKNSRTLAHIQTYWQWPKELLMTRQEGSEWGRRECSLLPSAPGREGETATSRWGSTLKSLQRLDRCGVMGAPWGPETQLTEDSSGSGAWTSFIWHLYKKKSSWLKKHEGILGSKDDRKITNSANQ